MIKELIKKRIPFVVLTGDIPLGLKEYMVVTEITGKKFAKHYGAMNETVYYKSWKLGKYFQAVSLNEDGRAEFRRLVSSGELLFKGYKPPRRGWPFEVGVYKPANSPALEGYSQ